MGCAKSKTVDLPPVKVPPQRTCGQTPLQKQTTYYIRKQREDEEVDGYDGICNWHVVDRSGVTALAFADNNETIVLRGQNGDKVLMLQHWRPQGDDAASGLVQYPLDGYVINLLSANDPSKIFLTIWGQLAVTKVENREYVRWHVYAGDSAETMFEIESGAVGEGRREVFLTSGWNGKGPVVATSSSWMQLRSWEDVSVTLPAGSEPHTMFMLLVATYLVEENRHLRPGPRNLTPGAGAPPRASMAVGRGSLVKNQSSARPSRATRSSLVGPRGSAVDNQFSLAVLRGQSSNGRKSNTKGGPNGFMKSRSGLSEAVSTVTLADILNIASDSSNEELLKKGCVTTTV
mmetsp:Transcript_95319/g.199367  ORF Transcript_95319/g.199367 Transcript_95319/m.199367 type:complete len:346 (-) Transcript_95319:261-1298(-)